MELVLLGVAALWLYTLHRGRRFVRAYMFLMYLLGGETPQQANHMVMRVGYFDAGDFARLAKAFSAEFYGGRQLPVIAEARSKGFKG